LLADMLMEAGQPAAALAEYEKSFQRDPNRFRGLYGAGRAAEARLRQHVLQNRSNFVDLRKGLIARNTGHNHNSCPGYINRGPGGSVELLFSNDCLLQFCGGFSQVKKLKDELDKRGWLISEFNRGVTRRSIWKDGGRKGRLYVTAVSEKAFEN
jgi:hypothetical protein